MDKELKFGQMVLNIKANGKMIKFRDLESFGMQMKMFTKVNLLVEKPMDMVNI